MVNSFTVYQRTVFGCARNNYTTVLYNFQVNRPYVFIFSECFAWKESVDHQMKKKTLPTLYNFKML